MYYYQIDQLIEVLAKFGFLPQGNKKFWAIMIESNSELRSKLEQYARILEFETHIKEHGAEPITDDDCPF